MYYEQDVNAMPIYTMGIDIGSSTSKCVILANSPGAAVANASTGSTSVDSACTNDVGVGGARTVAAHAANSTLKSCVISQGGTGTSGPHRVIGQALEQSKISIDDISFIAATGYGRNTFKNADKTLSELSCHAKGARWLCPEARTVIDIGGQDCKVMKLDTNGKLDSFVMNDKCAAGTGRFLEVMARVLELELSMLESLDEKAQHIVEITSTCAVFAESEVISCLSTGADIPGIVAGIHRSAALKAAGLAKRLTVTEPVFFTGGVSRNGGVKRALERELGAAVITDEHAQAAGAIGAALFAYENSIAER